MTEPHAAASPMRGPRSRISLSVQSKLLAMLLIVSLLAALVVGLIGYRNGQDGLRAAALEQLTTIRELRSDAIEGELADIQTNVRMQSRNASSVDGSRAFIAGFEALETATISVQEQATIDRYYEEQFVPTLEQRSGNDFSAETFVPATAPGRYLQYHYTVDRPVDAYDEALALHDAGDGSAWSAANAQYGPYFAGLVTELGYEDVLILNAESEVVYTAYKSVDLGVSMTEAPYTNSALSLAVQQVLRSGSLDAVVTTDFERYLPSLNVPTAWIVSPIGTETEIFGALAVQVPIEQINATLTGDQEWSAQGLGETGEVYIAGADGLMRSISRLLVERPEDYAERVVSLGTAPAIAERIAAVGGTVLLQPVDGPPLQAALSGESGTMVAPQYDEESALTAYAPLEIDGLQWAIVAQIDEDEAYAPVNEFARNLALSTLGIALVVSVLALLLAQVFARPLRRLTDAVRRLSAGDLTVQVPARGHDEFGELGAAFNEMAESLRVKQSLIEEQQSENDRLLHTLLPESVAVRYRQGEESIAEEHDNVSVVYAELIGLDDHARTLSGAGEIEQLNALMRGFDEAAAKAGVDRVRSLRGGYLASSGLLVPRVDNARRAVEFAREMRAVVQRFNAQQGTHLEVRAGVDTGAVKSGVVARTNLAYDLWGDAVNLAYSMRAAAPDPGIYVSQAIKDRLDASVEFVQAASIDTGGITQAVWRVV